MIKYKKGEVIYYHTNHSSFSWQNGLKIVLKISIKENTIWLCDLNDNGKPTMFKEKNKFMSSCTGINNMNITKTNLFYKLPTKFTHN